MRKILTVLGLSALSIALVVPSALATGSKENKKNQVKCGEPSVARVTAHGAAATAAVQVNGEGGPEEGGYAELCSDEPTAPLNGAVYAEGSSEGGRVAGDGDATNPPEGQGWAGADTNGNVGCAPDGQTNSRTADWSKLSPENCG